MFVGTFLHLGNVYVDIATEREGKEEQARTAEGRANPLCGRQTGRCIEPRLQYILAFLRIC